MNPTSFPPPALPAGPSGQRRWIELGGAAALDPAEAERVEQWLAEMFPDEDVDHGELSGPQVH